MTRSILLIDDDPGVLEALEKFFTRQGWIVNVASTAQAGLDAYDAERPDLVLLDLELPHVSGLAVLQRLRERDADAAVLMLTGHGDIATAVQAMRLGAENFLTKPVEFEHLDAAASRALEKVRLRRLSQYLSERQTETPELDALGSSELMRAVARQVKLLAATDTTVLLLGETGTGKGWVAHVLHALSARAAAPFVELNCAGLTATFLDSELFGHEKGAFTDAKTQKRGLFEIADRGTIFLDEIGDLAPELQPKLLKVLESRRFRRLGGTRELEVDVRVIAATNHELSSAVREGKFREDLYYRLAVMPLRLPPLRERAPEDLTGLALRILADLRRRLGRGPARIEPEALALLARHGWPGNIRELHNVLERALLLAPGADDVRAEYLPAELAAGTPGAAPTTELALSLDEVERRHIARVLAHHRGNRAAAARTLGLSRATLYEKLRRYGLEQIGRGGAVPVV